MKHLTNTSSTGIKNKNVRENKKQMPNEKQKQRKDKRNKKGNSCNGLKHTLETVFLTTQLRPTYIEEINWIQPLGQIKGLFSMALALRSMVDCSFQTIYL